MLNFFNSKLNLINQSVALTENSVVLVQRDWILYDPVDEIYQIFGSEFRVKNYWRRHAGAYDIEHRKFIISISNKVPNIITLESKGLSESEIFDGIYKYWDNYFIKSLNETYPLVTRVDFPWSIEKERLEFNDLLNQLNLNESQLNNLNFIDAY